MGGEGIFLPFFFYFLAIALYSRISPYYRESCLLIFTYQVFVYSLFILLRNLPLINPEIRPGARQGRCEERAHGIFHQAG